MWFLKKKKPRVCVIGLDGVPISLIRDLSTKGYLKTFAQLQEKGHLHQLKASLPEISSVSWSDFMTGTNSGTHGIFGFTDFKTSSYELRFPNFLNLETPTFWDKLGQAKKRVVVLNQPSTYPARRLPGILISGFVAIELEKAVFPASLLPQLKRINYEIDIDTFKCRQNHQLLWQQLASTLEGRRKAWELLWKEDWDYFEVVITGTDRLQHFLWTAYEDESHPEHHRCLEYYRQVDQLVGEIVNRFEKLTGGLQGLFLLSDHGFTGIKQEVYLNAWLEKEGFLRFTNSEEKSFSKLHPETVALALDPNRIYLHLEGKFPQGRIKPSEAESLKKTLREKLLQLTYEGERVIREVFDTQEIYSGPLVEKGPDLIALGEKGFDLKGSLKKEEIFGRTDLVGMHTWDDAFFWAQENHGQDLKIADLASIITRLLLPEE
ncbi:MAG: hypothetical protein DRJ11_06865 [Candidatus Aminicenantes bacterium]|nr:MAG: hypothetical protein DRJ11_06865 [Candidatus Aminicenantes bacterium]